MASGRSSSRGVSSKSASLPGHRGGGRTVRGRRGRSSRRPPWWCVVVGRWWSSSRPCVVVVDPSAAVVVDPSAAVVVVVVESSAAIEGVVVAEVLEHGPEAQLGGGADEVERPLLVVHAGQLHDDGVALAGDLRFGDAQGVDAAADDLDRLREGLVARLLGGLEHHGHPALEVEAQLRGGVGDQHGSQGDGGHEDDEDEGGELLAAHEVGPRRPVEGRLGRRRRLAIGRRDSRTHPLEGACLDGGPHLGHQAPASTTRCAG